jgi:hypothetical protein
VSRVNKKTGAAFCFALAAMASFIKPVEAREIPPGIDCSEIRGMADYLHGHRIVMIGEGHGTNEAPASFLRIVCAALRQGEEVAVGLEQLADQAAYLQNYLDSNGDLPARADLLGSNFWKNSRDGRGSVAMLKLIDGLRELRQAGYPLTVFPMQGTAADWHIRNDEKMAASIRAELTARPAALILTLSGNIHNMRTKPAWLPDTIPPPIPTYLQDIETFTFNLTSTGGSAWDCQKDCGVHSAALREGTEEFVVKVLKADSIYTGEINIGQTTASPPAAETFRPH